jgi:hypothetical protein
MSEDQLACSKKEFEFGPGVAIDKKRQDGNNETAPAVWRNFAFTDRQGSGNGILKA